MGKNIKTHAARHFIIWAFVALLSSAVSAGHSSRKQDPPAPTLAQLQRENDLILDLIYTREKILSKKHKSPDSESN